VCQRVGATGLHRGGVGVFYLMRDHGTGQGDYFVGRRGLLLGRQ
jgi:hypothetical protein